MASSFSEAMKKSRAEPLRGAQHAPLNFLIASEIRWPLRSTALCDQGVGLPKQCDQGRLSIIAEYAHFRAKQKLVTVAPLIAEFFHACKDRIAPVGAAP
jgi:hypothetical protein